MGKYTEHPLGKKDRQAWEKRTYQSVKFSSVQRSLVPTFFYRMTCHCLPSSNPLASTSWKLLPLRDNVDWPELIRRGSLSPSLPPSLPLYTNTQRHAHSHIHIPVKVKKKWTPLFFDIKTMYVHSKQSENVKNNRKKHQT